MTGTDIGALASAAIIPIFILAVIIVALIRGADVYSAFVRGASKALDVVIKILPAMGAMLIALNALRESGALAAFIDWLAPLCAKAGVPPELIPLMLLRPFSGSASLGILGELMAHHGADGLIGLAASIMMGSSETIFYTLSLYFGAIGVTKTRHCLWISLVSGAVGMAVSIMLAYRL